MAINLLIDLFTIVFTVLICWTVFSIRNSWKKPGSDKRVLGIELAIYLGIYLVFIYAIYYAPYQLTIKYQTFQILDTQNPVKIVFISDIHAGIVSEGYLRYVVDQINKEDPDMILIGGDFIHVDESETHILEPLRGLKAKQGVYSILGNHDYGLSWSNRETAGKVKAYLESIGIDVLINENKELQIEGNKIELIGLGSYWAGETDYDKATEGIDEKLPKIILIHEQEGLDISKVKGNAIILAGHTHCGQVRVPFLGSIPKLFGFKGDVDMERGKIGHYEIYTTCGIGGTPRFLTGPEITIIRLE
ncbi:MAG: metallophosphoesterase [Candidatus Micrarchaeota archaeon]